MPFTKTLLDSVSNDSPEQAWTEITNYLWTKFSAPIAPAVADAEVVTRDRSITELENVLSGSCWDLWESFDATCPKASRGIVDFWNRIQGGKAVLILDGLSLRETPWLLQEAEKRGYTVEMASARATEIPGETTPFANALGFSQRSALENNLAGKAHKLTGAVTEASDLPWRDCIERVGNSESVVFWHHWPDERMHELSKPGGGLHKLAKETHSHLTSDDFWTFAERLGTGRRLLITGDHGYAACGLFPDLAAKDQVAYMKNLFKSGRTAPAVSDDGSWVPPIDLRLTTSHGSHQFVLGR